MSALFNLKWLGSAALALGISTVALWPEMASANIVFDFSGLCDFPNSGCPTASDTATGVLTLTDGYVYGTEITSAVFVSFSYTSNLTFAPIASDNLRTVFGILNSDGSSGGNFAVQAISGRFLAFAQTWAAEDDSAAERQCRVHVRVHERHPAPSSRALDLGHDADRLRRPRLRGPPRLAQERRSRRLILALSIGAAWGLFPGGVATGAARLGGQGGARRQPLTTLGCLTGVTEPIG